MRQIITLTTDFGFNDSFVGQLKGSILERNPDVDLIDLCHGVPKFDIATGARILKESIAYYPSATIHVGVVDPGVGGNRKRIIVEAKLSSYPQEKTAFFVGPDNGLFSLALKTTKEFTVWEISNLSQIPRGTQSTTFDGRDIFGPVAALLAKGIIPNEFGSVVDKIIHLDEDHPQLTGTTVEGRVRFFDSFGNAVTNIHSSIFAGKLVQAFLPKYNKQLRVVKAYGQLESGELGVVINSEGFVEVAANATPVQEITKLMVNDVVTVFQS